MKKALLLPLILVAGVGVGGGSAYAVTLLLPHQSRPAKHDVETAFVPTTKVLAPLVFPDGRLSGYVSFEFQLEVPADKVEFVSGRMPLLLHAINLRTYRTPLASGPNGMLPNLDSFRRVVMQSAPEAFGPGVVKRAAVTKAEPA